MTSEEAVHNRSKSLSDTFGDQCVAVSGKRSTVIEFVHDLSKSKEGEYIKALKAGDIAAAEKNLLTTASGK